MIKLKHMLFENAQSDFEARKKAFAIIGAIKKNIKTNNFIYDIRKDTHGSYVIMETKLDSGLIFAIIFTNGVDFNLQNTGGGYIKKNNAVIVFDEENQGWKPNTLPTKPKIKKTILDYISFNTEVISHELIHSIDAMRFKTPSQWPITNLQQTTKKEGEDELMQKYYNAPTEFNAYYQQAASSVDEELDRLSKAMKGANKLQKETMLHLDTFENFKYFFEMSYEAVYYLNDKYKAKYNKRLYLFYIYCKEKYLK